MYDNPFMMHDANTKGIAFVVDYYRRVKRRFLGPAFVEGTWVGYATGLDQEIYYVVETYEQTWTKVKGYAVGLTESGKVYVRWRSEVVDVQPKTGTLSQLSSCYYPSSGQSSEIVACFVLLREGSQKAPTRKEGFVVDAAGENRQVLIQVKASERILDPQDALSAARDFYRRTGVRLGTLR